MVGQRRREPRLADDHAARGGTTKVVDNDVVPHKLVKTSGLPCAYQDKPAMRHMIASVSVTFAKAGTYRFTTKAGEDYPACT